jgi:hypothetical protein
MYDYMTGNGEVGRTEMTTVNGADVIDFLERFNFNLGCAIDCIARAGRKPGLGDIADLEKARWHLDREIKLIKHDRNETGSSSQSAAIRPASQVRRLDRSQQNGTVWQDRMGDKYRFNGDVWEYQAAGQNNWEPVRFREILTDFGPYTALVDH